MAKPKYVLIAEYIKNEINSGKINSGEIISSEYTLCDQFEASRMTVRKGLTQLTNEGYIYSVPGKGYFVSEPSKDKYLLYFNEMGNIEKTAEETILIDVNVKYPDEVLAKKLNIKTSRRIIVIRRFLVDKGRKIAYDEKNIPYQRGLPIVENEISYATFPEIAAKKKSVFALKKELSIKTGSSDEYLSRQMNININEPLLIIEQRLLDEKSNPIGLGITKFAGEFIQLNAVSLI